MHRAAIWSLRTLVIFPLHLRTQKRYSYELDIKGDKKHMKCIYVMRMRNLFSLYVPFTIIY